MFALDKFLFMLNVDDGQWICAVIFVEDNSIQYYDSVGGDVHSYTTGKMRYMKDEWEMRTGGELP